jgi:hypothetical protein
MMMDVAFTAPVVLGVPSIIVSTKLCDWCRYIALVSSIDQVKHYTKYDEIHQYRLAYSRLLGGLY